MLHIIKQIAAAVTEKSKDFKTFHLGYTSDVESTNLRVSDKKILEYPLVLMPPPTWEFRNCKFGRRYYTAPVYFYTPHGYENSNNKSDLTEYEVLCILDACAADWAECFMCAKGICCVKSDSVITGDNTTGLGGGRLACVRIDLKFYVERECLLPSEVVIDIEDIDKNKLKDCIEL